MWNRKKEQELPFKPASQPVQSPAFAPAQTQGVSMASPSFRPEPEPLRGSATIGKNVTITGQIFSREDIIIDGEVEGTVEAAENKLTIGPNGKVKATIHAREVVIIGSVQGNVEALERVDIRKDARLLGDIRTARIVIEDGAVFKGSIDIVKTEAKAPAAKPPVAPQPTPSVTPTTQAINTNPEVKR